MGSSLKEVPSLYRVGDKIRVIDGVYRGAVVVVLGQPKRFSPKIYRCEVIEGDFDRFISVEEDHFDPNSVVRGDEEV